MSSLPVEESWAKRQSRIGEVSSKHNHSYYVIDFGALLCVDFMGEHIAGH